MLVIIVRIPVIPHMFLKCLIESDIIKDMDVVDIIRRRTALKGRYT